MPLKDADIRAAVVAKLKTHAQLRLVHEWDVGSIVDVAAISRAEPILHGYEIKSDVDSCARLTTQALHYSRVFDTMTLVVSSRLYVKACNIVPAWWSIVQPFGISGGVQLDTMRVGRNNPRFDRVALLGLLWSRELRALMHQHCLDHRRYTSRYQMIDRLQPMPLDVIKRDVVKRLLMRTEWKDVDGGRASSAFLTPYGKSLRTIDAPA